MGYNLGWFYTFLSGAGMMGAFTCAAFFFRFWKKTGERIFLIFGLTFTTLAIERFVLAGYNAPQEHQAFIYLIRLFAFGMLLLGIWDKNRQDPRRTR
jgi:hypothetical protein